MGFSHFFKFIQKPFDAQAISRFVAKAQGQHQDEVLGKWDGQRDAGTRIDAALELYAQTGQILESDADISDLIKNVLTEYKDYHKCFEQLVVYDDDSRLAGSLDKLFLFSNRKDSAFGISDFKAFEKDDLHKHRGWMNAPFDYLPDTKYTKISFQLSFYAHFFEKLTGRKCKQLFIHLIDPVNKTHQKIPVFYLKREVMFAIEHCKEMILAELNVEEGF